MKLAEVYSSKVRDDGQDITCHVWIALRFSKVEGSMVCLVCEKLTEFVEAGTSTPLCSEECVNLWVKRRVMST